MSGFPANFHRTKQIGRKQPQHLESMEQRLFVQRFRLDPITKYLPACAIPNGGRRSIREAAILKAEGVTAGAPDWVLFQVSADQKFYGLALEFKSPTGKGRVTQSQQYFHDALRMAGWDVQIVKSAEEAWAALTRYLNLPT